MGETETFEKPEEKMSGKTFAQSFWELVRFAIIALIIVIPIRVFITEPFVVSGDSMIPTFDNGNYLIVDKISYKINSPERNDVIVFKYPNDIKKYYIKRIIGLPNETVDINGEIVTITNDEYKDGLVLDQSYIKNQEQNKVHNELKKRFPPYKNIIFFFSFSFDCTQTFHKEIEINKNNAFHTIGKTQDGGVKAGLISLYHSSFIESPAKRLPINPAL